MQVPRLKCAVFKPTKELLNSDDEDDSRTKHYKRYRRIMNLSEPLTKDINTSRMKYPDLDYLNPEEVVRLNTKYLSKFNELYCHMYI